MQDKHPTWFRRHRLLTGLGSFVVLWAIVYVGLFVLPQANDSRTPDQSEEQTAQATAVGSVKLQPYGGQTTPPQEASAASAILVKFSLAPTLVDGKVEGSTNLPDGTELSASLVQDYACAPHCTPGVFHATVAAGHFQIGPLQGLQPGPYALVVSTPLADLEPRDVQVVIGTNGEKMTGPYVKNFRGLGYVAEITARVTVGNSPSPGQVPEGALGQLLRREQMQKAPEAGQTGTQTSAGSPLASVASPLCGALKDVCGDTGGQVPATVCRADPRDCAKPSLYSPNPANPSSKSDPYFMEEFSAAAHRYLKLRVDYLLNVYTYGIATKCKVISSTGADLMAQMLAQTMFDYDPSQTTTPFGSIAFVDENNLKIDIGTAFHNGAEDAICAYFNVHPKEVERLRQVQNDAFMWAQ